MLKLRSLARFASILVLLPILTSCALLSGSDGTYLYSKAQIESIAINIMESFPVQVSVVANGFLADGCTELHNIKLTRSGSTFEIEIQARRPKEAVCIQVVSLFEEVITLDVLNLPAGTYDVNVNGVSESFELQMDNTPS